MQHPKYARMKQLLGDHHLVMTVLQAFHEPFEVTGRLVNGTPITMDWEDKGDWIPGHRSDGTRYEAFTAWYQVRNVQARFEDYIQTPKSTVPRKGAYDFLAGQRMQALRLAGIDPDSLMMDNGEPLFPKE